MHTYTHTQYTHTHSHTIIYIYYIYIYIYRIIRKKLEDFEVCKFKRNIFFFHIVSILLKNNVSINQEQECLPQAFI